MEPKLSKQLQKASELLKSKMLVHQEMANKLQDLKTAFLKETDPVKKEKYKNALIRVNKEVKAAEVEATKAENLFNNILAKEPDDEVYDLLDHVVAERLIKSKVKSIVTEEVYNAQVSSLLTEAAASKKISVDGVKYLVISGISASEFYISFIPSTNKDLQLAYEKGKATIVKGIEKYLEKSMKNFGSYFKFNPNADQAGHTFTIKANMLGEYILEMLK